MASPPAAPLGAAVDQLGPAAASPTAAEEETEAEPQRVPGGSPAAAGADAAAGAGAAAVVEEFVVAQHAQRRQQGRPGLVSFSLADAASHGSEEEGQGELVGMDVEAAEPTGEGVLAAVLTPQGSPPAASLAAPASGRGDDERSPQLQQPQSLTADPTAAVAAQAAPVSSSAGAVAPWPAASALPDHSPAWHSPSGSLAAPAGAAAAAEPEAMAVESPAASAATAGTAWQSPQASLAPSALELGLAEEALLASTANAPAPAAPVQLSPLQSAASPGKSCTQLAPRLQKSLLPTTQAVPDVAALDQTRHAH